MFSYCTFASFQRLLFHFFLYVVYSMADGFSLVYELYIEISVKINFHKHHETLCSVLPKILHPLMYFFLSVEFEYWTVSLGFWGATSSFCGVHSFWRISFCKQNTEVSILFLEKGGIRSILNLVSSQLFKKQKQGNNLNVTEIKYVRS